MTRNSCLRGGGCVANRSTRTSGFVLALGVGLAVATGHGVAWADTNGGHSAGGSVNHSGSAGTRGASEGPASLSGIATASGSSSGAAAALHGAQSGPSSSVSSSGGAKSKATDTGGPATRTPVLSPTGTAPTPPFIPPKAAHSEVGVAAQRGSSRTAQTGSSARSASPASVVSNSEPAQPASPVHTDTAPAATTPIAAHAAQATTAVRAVGATLSAAAVTTAAVGAAASSPAAVSPIATILALPARLVDELLGFVGITTISGTTPTPISPAPLVQLLFVAFRRWENIAGLDSPSAAPPVTISQTFTGSLTTPTPTVAQFLDAATAEYVLGGVPGGLTPFTVNGWPVTSTNELTGESAQVWVTPQKQIIIAYQGTTGGTNLLFNPLIAVSQIITDTLGTLTDTTPPAFSGALEFAQQVQAEAAQQGYAPSSIFVTGHSLGGWEAEYVAQNTGLGGIGFESLGLSTTVPGNGADSLFVNTVTYGDPVGYSATDLPGLQPFEAPYVAGGGTKPHYGSIVLLGDPSAQTPLTNAAALWGTSIVGDITFLAASLGQLFEYHLPGEQAYNLDVNPEPDLLPGTPTDSGPIETGFGNLTIPELLQAASAAGILIEP